MTAWDAPAPLTEDRRALLRPHSHPADQAAPHVWVGGQGAVLADATGREYLDGLACLWNMNVGHGRTELAEAAAAQMAILACATNYTGSASVRDILCFAPPLVITPAQVDRLVEATRGPIAAVLPASA